MNAVAKQTSDRLFEMVIGLAAGCLALRLVRLLESIIRWALVRFAGSDVMGGRFGAGVILPPDAPWLTHAMQLLGGTILAAAVVVAVAPLASRLPKALALACAFTAFWFASSLFSALTLFARLGRGSMQTAVNAIGLPMGDAAPLRWLFAATVTLAILYLLRVSIRGAQLYPLTSFLLPAAALYWFLPEAQADRRFLERIGIEHLPLTLAALVTLAAWKWKPWEPKVNQLLSGALVCVGAVALFTPLTLATYRGPSEAVGWVPAESANWRISFESEAFNDAEREEWLRGADADVPRYRERLGIRKSQSPLEANVAKTWQGFQAIVNDRRYDGDFYQRAGAAPVMLAGSSNRSHNPLAEALILMRQTWGEAASEVVARAVARYASGSYYGADLREYAARIACEERRYPAAEIFNVDQTYLSPLVRDAVSGAWIENFVSRQGITKLQDVYRLEPNELLAMCADCVPVCREPVEALPETVRLLPYQKGISFSHEVGGNWGYGSEAADRELLRISDLGGNAIALVPYSFTAAPDELTIRFRTDETDDRLLRSLRSAHTLGLKVMLKPHLWAGRRFHGDIEFDKVARFDAWFAQYRRWLLHFARFAELHRVDLLAIGNELSGLTVHEGHWRGLISDIRKIYSGPITYAAHWNGEFGQVSFWDQLDYIGVNFYFPMAEDRERPAANAVKISETQARIQAVSKKFDKPILFTEVGFPALKTAASRPWEENSSGLDAALQKQCYEAWFQYFSQEPNVAGMYWWKWPTHGRSGPFDTSHRPVGKPAVEVLRKWFEEL